MNIMWQRRQGAKGERRSGWWERLRWLQGGDELRRVLLLFLVFVVVVIFH